MRYKVMFMVNDDENHVGQSIITYDRGYAFDYLEAIAEQFKDSEVPFTFWMEQEAGWEIVEGSVRLGGKW